VRVLIQYLILTLILTATAQADIVLSLGAGKGIMGDHGTPFERVAALGYQKAWGDFFIRPEAGWFMDISGQGRKTHDDSRPT